MKKGIWFPDVWQVSVLRPSENRGFLNYARSVFIGLTMMPLNLPYNVYIVMRVKGLSRFTLRHVWAGLYTTIIVMPVLGFTGCLNSIKDEPKQALKRHNTDRANF